MKLAKFSIAAITINALFIVAISTVLAAGSGKNIANQRGGKAAEHMSSNGSFNSNAQWSADPERGWVRAEERHKLHEKGGASADAAKNGKQKGKGKANRY